MKAGRSKRAGPVEVKARAVKVNAPPAKAQTRAVKAGRDPYLQELIEKVHDGKTVLRLRKGEKVFSQGEAAGAMCFIQTGKIKITVVSPGGKEAVLALLGPGGFLGEGSLIGQTLRLGTATAMQASTLVRIERRAMLKALHAQPGLAERFIASLLVRNLDLQEDLCDQLFNNSEKRLARVLLKMARFGQFETRPATKVTRVSHEALAEMVGTTRSRVTHFMNKFRALGLIDYNGPIDYNGQIIVRAELLVDVVLHD